MKRIIFTLLLTTTSFLLLSQPIARDKVILEIGTGTWCQYCPGAAMGADDLIDNGHDVAVIEYHNGDSFTNTASDARNAYNGVGGYPTAHFDGVLVYEGGSNSTSMYSNYLPLYNQRIVIDCDFTVEIFGQLMSGNTYDMIIRVTNVNSNTTPNLKLHLVYTESEIVYSWQGQSELNFVERLMAPDHLGTDLDFSSGNVQIINLSVTLDPTWNTTHCEWVSFIQDNVSHEILQGTKVEHDALQAFQATANYSCSSQQPCVTNQVDYYDNSLGNVISWDWTFEGGTPATSTMQNPSVTYNTTGDYNVQLIVSDGAVIDTLTNLDYINVITIPVQPNTPTGATHVCSGDIGVEYTTDPVADATDYTWAIDPANAGTITDNGTSALIDVEDGFEGDYTIKVRADNSCGDGVWSATTTTTSQHVPELFSLSEGGGFCQGEIGIEVSLDGSEIGVDYELYLDGAATGLIEAGTGSSLDFGYQTAEGIYTCLGYNAHCDASMIGNSYIYQQEPPPQAASPFGPTEVCGNSANTDYTTDGATGATTYVWELTPTEAGVLSPFGLTATVDWSPTYVGAVDISVKGVNDCGEGPFSAALEVMSYAPPQPDISGETLVCNDQTNVIYQTSFVDNNNYDWVITGGTIASGTGTNEINVT